MALRTRGLLPVPSSEEAQRGELLRLTRELALTPPGHRRRVLSIERRRVLVALHGR